MLPTITQKSRTKQKIKINTVTKIKGIKNAETIIKIKVKTKNAINVKNK